MAVNISTLESHPQRLRIIEAIAAGRPLREIAAWSNPPVTAMALSRYKSRAMAITDAAVIAAKKAISNIDKEIRPADSLAVTKAALTVATDPFLAHAMRTTARRERWIERAETSEGGPDFRTLASLDRNDLTALELHAKLAGRLDSPSGNQTNITIVCPAVAAPEQRESTDSAMTIDVTPQR